LTRWELQEVLMEVWSRTKVTAICVTHDVDEAILLADRVVMMTNGPMARIGRIMQVDLERPRKRAEMLAHQDYYLYREQLLSFLEEYEHGAHKKTDSDQTSEPNAGEAAEAEPVAPPAAATPASAEQNVAA
ncbi:MAG: ABC transporter ATP-binding protein, partial [Pseudomonadota bacterium]